jgi:hypothetical protein
MGKKLVVELCIFLALDLVSVGSAQLNVGVKAGAWVEYQVTFNGTPPDSSHDISMANMTARRSVPGLECFIVSSLYPLPMASRNHL